MTDKYYIDPEQLLADSFRLAQQVHRSGYEPTFIMALWAVRQLVWLCRNTLRITI